MTSPIAWTNAPELAAYLDLLPLFDQARFASWRERLDEQMERAFNVRRHGDWSKWRALLRALPRIEPDLVDLNQSTVRVKGECDESRRLQIRGQLQALHPWRKGPYSIHDVVIDTEWRSDMKWDRLAAHIRPLCGRTVLDVGCGSGYHGWRMVGAGAKCVIGIDPTLLSVVQFLTVQHFLGSHPFYVLPIGIDEVPAKLRTFDTVFSMGVFYHRRSPLDHLLELKGCLRSGGELVLETLVIEGQRGEVLVPEGRYASMRNVWFIPTCLTLESWLKRCGFKRVRLIDVSVTTASEQRSTDWMRFQSLGDFLDPKNPQLTIEGLPAPRRAILLAEAP